jgi:Flp pilus assembly protein TadD
MRLNTTRAVPSRSMRPESSILSRAAALDSGNVTVLFNLGMIRWHSGDINGAHGLWLRALKRSPKDETVLYWFALAEKKLRESDADKQLSSGR